MFESSISGEKVVGKALMKSKIRVRAISDLQDLGEIEKEWNHIVNQSSSTPFLFCEFVKQILSSSTFTGWTPLIVVIYSEQKILSISPLLTKKRFGFRQVKFIQEPWCSDFISIPNRDVCMTHLLEFLFNILKCRFAEFVLSTDSPNLGCLQRKCQDLGINYDRKPEVGRRIVVIQGAWEDFLASRSGKFRKNLRRVERFLSEAGSLKVINVNGIEKTNLLRTILDVETKSWKQEYRVNHGNFVDQELLQILKASSDIAKREPNFKWSVKFLELNGETIAYCLVLEYKGIAYVVKTSYRRQFEKMRPGFYIQNLVVQEKFIEGQRRYVDFLSDLPYIQNWADICIPRVRIRLTKGYLPSIIRFLFYNVYSSKVLKIIIDRFRFIRS